MAYIFAGTFKGTDTNSAAQTVSGNFGSGSQFVVVAIVVQNGSAVTSAVLNSITLTAAAGTSQTASGTTTVIYYGTVTLTGSDSVVVTCAGALNFLDVLVGVWTMPAPTFISGNQTNTGGALGTTSTTGDYVFMVWTNTSITMTPTPTNTQTLVGNNGIPIAVADWTSGTTGTFTATGSGGTIGGSMADFTPAGGGGGGDTLMSQIWM